MPIKPFLDGNQTIWTPDYKSVQPPLYYFPVVLNENFSVNQANSNTPSQVMCRALNAVVDLTDPAGTSFSYLAMNGQTLTATIGHNGIFPLVCYGISAMASGILSLEWCI